MMKAVRVYSASDMTRLVPRASIVETVRGRRLLFMRDYACLLGDVAYEFIGREPDGSFTRYILLEPNLEYVKGHLYVRSILESAHLPGLSDSCSDNERYNLCVRAEL